MRSRVGRALVVVVAIGSSAAGCGGGGPRVVPVSGVVTLNGKPLEGASIVFTPAPDSKDAQVAMDTTGPNGNYIAMTNGRSGVVPGKYKITVQKLPGNPTVAAGGEEEDPYMASLATGPQDPTLNRGKKAADKVIKDDFDREIPPEGGTQDFDVKASAPGQAAS